MDDTELFLGGLGVALDSSEKDGKQSKKAESTAVKFGNMATLPSKRQPGV